jgi:uncharacterized protein YcbK (DUF882 family)
VLARRKLLTLGLGCAASAGVAAVPTLGWAQSLTSTDEIDGMLTASAISTAPPQIAPPPAPTTGAMRSVAMNNLHTGESLEAVYWDQGDYIADVLEQVNSHLRDFRTGDVHPIDPRLLDVLDAVAQRTESKSPFQVISGYRSPKTNAMLHERSAEVAKKSLHTQGMAIDVRLPDVELQHLHAAALSLGRGGVGFYPYSNFVHIDVGPVRHWQGA